MNHTGPIKPPIRACDTLMGMPKCVHSHTQITDPKSAARIKYSLMHDACTIPSPIVWATLTPKMKIAAKFQKAAQMTAIVGLNTFVATMVAMELAASFIPFRKSKSNAMTIAINTMDNITLRRI